MTHADSLAGRRILIVEDDYLIMSDLALELESQGAVVLEPCPSVRQALATITAESRIDAAVLDVNLAGEQVFPVAAALLERAIPFLFTTGYDAEALPADYAKLPRCRKPVDAATLLKTLSAMVGPRPA